MVSEGLVLTAINKKFEGKSLTKTFKENLAKKWAVKIDNETEIDGYIEDREDVILEASTEADRRATEAIKKLTPKQEIKTEEKLDDVKVADDAPEWAKALIKQNEALNAKISGFETQQTQKTLLERFKSSPELKGVPEFMFKGRVPSTEEEFENAVAELKTDYTAFATENKIASLGNDVPSAGGNRNSDTVKPASKEEVDRIFNNINRI